MSTLCMATMKMLKGLLWPKTIDNQPEDHCCKRLLMILFFSRTPLQKWCVNCSLALLIMWSACAPIPAVSQTTLTASTCRHNCSTSVCWTWCAWSVMDTPSACPLQPSSAGQCQACVTKSGATAETYPPMATVLYVSPFTLFFSKCMFLKGTLLNMMDCSTFSLFVCHVSQMHYAPSRSRRSLACLVWQVQQVKVIWKFDSTWLLLHIHAQTDMLKSHKKPFIRGAGWLWMSLWLLWETMNAAITFPKSVWHARLGSMEGCCAHT